MGHPHGLREDKMMGRIPEAIADTLVAEVESRTEWDEAPALYTFYVESGRCRLAQIPLPEMVWSLAAPPAVLASFADAGLDEAVTLQAVAPPGLYGAPFRCEAWEVDGGKPGTEQRRQALADSKARRLNTRADRVEIRSIYGVDRGGVTCAVAQRRGEADVRCSIAYPKPGHGFAGTIPNALDRLVTAFLGVSMPARKGIGVDD